MAPANVLSCFVLGVEAAVPGWRLARISPPGGTLSQTNGKVPITRGSIRVDWH